MSQLGGPETPAIGFAIGLERLTILLQQLQGESPKPALDFYVVSRGEKAEPAATVLAQKLRHGGCSVEIDLSGSAFGKQFKRADRSGAVACLIIGDAEAESGQVQLKWLASGEQTELSQAALIEGLVDIQAKLQQARRAGKG